MFTISSQREDWTGLDFSDPRKNLHQKKLKSARLTYISLKRGITETNRWTYD
jgi:hypothetical protein